MINIYPFMIVVILMYLGVVRHYFNLRKTRRTSVSLWTYIAFGTRTRQGAKIGTILMSAIAACNTGIGDWVNPVVLWHSFAATGDFKLDTLALALGFIAAGYAIDSDANNIGGGK